MDEQEIRSTRTPRRSNKKQQKTTLMIIIAVVLLIIGGIIGSAFQSGKTKSVKKQLESVTLELNQVQGVYDTKIAALEAEIAEKQKALDEAGQSVSEPLLDDSESDSAPTVDTDTGDEPTKSSGNGWFGKLIIVLIIIILIISALFIALNSFTKNRDDDEDDEDDDDDYDYDYDEDDTDEDDEE